ncbi:nicotinate-nucleotide adenylyltransferase [Caldichromatium japonicum]|uniref:Probable nicotinate-nucleotide adenylyltransferase n=1 Tax=Caldichromatium japonicum TaxID=2699430 RepID=A0A6G7VDT1_9GAMM|nr:nicotinate-nucleotide adenylyltransferase [Caldichromatium japonicum]QIK38008.1 nicotinate-nucleotide adenylyltransferase [Caldichromatium japonicum]
MIGIFGGTFDPIHHGHLRAALECLEQLRLDQIRFIPLKTAVHRPPPVASPRQRAAMLEAALAGEPRFILDLREFKRSGPSYTYDTLASLRAEIGGSRPLCLLLGSDAYAGFLSWYRPLEILRLAHLVVMHRPGYPPLTDTALADLYRERACQDSRELALHPSGSILLYAMTPLAISSTQIRALIAAGLSPRYLLPDTVLGYINNERLYLP